MSEEMENADICHLCYETYKETLRPRVLHCGHTYCTDCINKLILNGRLACPTCNTEFASLNPSQIPINYSLEKCIALMKVKKAVVSKSPPPDKVRTMQDIINSQKLSANDLLLSSEAVNRDLSDYQDFLKSNVMMHMDLVLKLNKRALLHETIVKHMTEEQEKVKEVQNQAAFHSKNMKDALPQLDSADNNKDVAVAVAKITEIFGDLANCISKCQLEFPDPEIVLSQMEVGKIVEALDDEDSLCKKDFCASVLSSNCLTISEKIDMCNKGTLSFTVSQLRSNPDAWKKTIKSGRVFAVSSTNGRDRSAVLSVKDNKFFLHCLQDQKVPPFSYKIEHSEIVGCVGEGSSVAFLDLEWGGSFQGRIYIGMSSNTDLAKHFMAICTGELGPTYINKKFYDADESRGWLSCESYDNKGLFGTNILNSINFDDGVYRCAPEMGIVWMNKDGKFHILTGSVNGGRYSRVFGKVQVGLDVLKKAHARRLSGFNDIIIVGCGVVLQV
ncbi:uncharacterized protein [Palaemon carinicauda]|uniref:uncharacterized protein n=1 Tax=Palaemon carinicauda TaxID=392227 RepID=UPI0035B63C99